MIWRRGWAQAAEAMGEGCRVSSHMAGLGAGWSLGRAVTGARDLDCASSRIWRLKPGGWSSGQGSLE